MVAVPVLAVLVLDSVTVIKTLTLNTVIRCKRYFRGFFENKIYNISFFNLYHGSNPKINIDKVFMHEDSGSCKA